MGKDKGKKEEAPKQEPPTVPHVSSPQTDPYAADPVLSQMPRPSSVFEFGPTVSVGSDYMRGVCTGDNPDAIQACTWTIEEAQGKPKEKRHVFRVEF
ncbi:hypothetical protein HYH03_015173 [Edaphochlamys debaryana]|uniref:Uncharacterized protein n=1 Tax=Edaphochlamys debaryana TaxID=47281 RepID=A0A835XLT2_9CHLO|nr:hypothetical protein HYH03_015173 [Edaphochlamys debaryana]|eukprot:KAG2486211.1 hypothetical protein HYH03_015173 [Edaphochlamys debaryana]